MKIIKRGQLAMLSIAFMVMIAGYINYKYNPEREENLGQTMKVNSSDVYLYNVSNDNVDVYGESDKSKINKTTDNIYTTKTVSDSLSSFKEARDNMFSELEEKYTGIIESVSASSSDVKVYREKLDEVIKNKHTINIVEGIIKAKGIDNIVIVPTSEKYNIMIKLETKLTDAQAAMIEKIIEEEFNIDASKVNIIEN